MSVDLMADGAGRSVECTNRFGICAGCSGAGAIESEGNNPGLHGAFLVFFGGGLSWVF